MKSRDILRIENFKYGRKTYTLRWRMTLLCNYYCDFCIQGSKEQHILQAKKESAQTREIICEKLIALMESLNGKAESIRLYLLGGEITILKDFFPILSRLIEARFEGMLEILITTNLSMDVKSCRKLVSMANGKKNRRLILTCSYYPQKANEKEFFRKIGILTGRNLYRRILRKWFHKQGLSCSIAYPLCSDEEYEQYRQFIQRHTKYEDRIKYIIIRNYKTSISESTKKKLHRTEKPNIKVTFKNGRTESVSENQNIGLLLDGELYFQPKGFLCDIKRKNLNIDELGNMSYCASAIDETMFGNICFDPPVFSEEKIRCQARWCGCGYYSILENDLGDE